MESTRQLGSAVALTVAATAGAAAAVSGPAGESVASTATLLDGALTVTFTPLAAGLYSVVITDPVLSVRMKIVPVVESLGVTVGDCADYLNGSWPSEEILNALLAEAEAQNARCVTFPYTADLREALLRRVAANLARRQSALGVVVGDSGEVAALPSTVDREVHRLEAPYRRFTVG